MSKIQADNPYQKWFVENYKPPLHENELEKFVDQKAKVGVFTEKDLEIYLKGMKKEKEFIESAVLI